MGKGEGGSGGRKRREREIRSWLVNGEGGESVGEKVERKRGVG